FCFKILGPSLLLDRLESLQETWDAYHDEGTVYLTALSNHFMQRSMTLSLNKEGAIPVGLLGKDPHRVSRLVGAQSTAIKENVIHMRELVNGWS
ncbi:hypothetical protein BC829DRAFT_54122, partial [Chytridium lagenaria]